MYLQYINNTRIIKDGKKEYNIKITLVFEYIQKY